MLKGLFQPELSYDAIKHFKLCPVWWDSQHWWSSQAESSSNMKKESYIVGIPFSSTSNTTYYGRNLVTRFIQFKQKMMKASDKITDQMHAKPDISIRKVEWKGHMEKQSANLSMSSINSMCLISIFQNQQNCKRNIFVSFLFRKKEIFFFATSLKVKPYVQKSYTNEVSLWRYYGNLIIDTINY